ncbi:MAG: hypothetical protein AAF688_08535 [Bacteroidota bacterium]
MKNILYIGLFLVTLNLTAQSESIDWITDYKTAFKTAEQLDKPVLAFATNGQSSAELKLLEGELFGSETFQSLKDKVVFLKLNTADDMYAMRMATHFTKSKTGPSVALVQSNQRPLGEPLNKINSGSISNFINVLKAEIQ